MSSVLFLLPEALEELVVSCPTDETHFRPPSAGLLSGEAGAAAKVSSAPHLSPSPRPRNPHFLSLLTQKGWGLLPCTWEFGPVILFCRTPLCFSCTHRPGGPKLTFLQTLTFPDILGVRAAAGGTGLKPTGASLKILTWDGLVSYLWFGLRQVTSPVWGFFVCPSVNWRKWQELCFRVSVGVRVRVPELVPRVYQVSMTLPWASRLILKPGASSTPWALLCLSGQWPQEGMQGKFSRSLGLW